MRHLLLAFMIALLPVRGWVGNAMAIGMASQQVAMAQANSVDAAMNAELAMPADCPMHAQAVSDQGADTDPTAAAGLHCNGCDACQLCLALASLTWTHVTADSPIPDAAPLANASRFSDADSVASLKPPIS